MQRSVSEPSRRSLRIVIASAMLCLATLTPVTAGYAAVASQAPTTATFLPPTGELARNTAQARQFGPTTTYTVRPGDWLTGIASRSCGSTAAWRAIYTANRTTIGANPNRIYPGQRLTLNCKAAPASSSTSSSSGAWRAPLSGWRLTSCYGMRWGALHRGIDMAASYGTPIRAVAAGTVRVAGWHWSGYGIEVVIDHGDGWLTHYAHQSREVVYVGQRVKAGQTIGYVGATGDATGPHLHFEAMHSLAYGSQVNPAPVLRSHGVRIGC